MEFRFLLVNALDNRYARFFYPTNTPQGLLLLKAGIRAAFPEVHTRLLAWNNLDERRAEAEFAEILGTYKPDAVGISAYTHMMPRAIAIAEAVKAQCPATPVILGGVHASAYPEGIVRYPMFDYYVRREGVRVAPRLLRHLFLGESRPEDIPSLAFVRAGRAVLTEPERLPADMDVNPVPDWSELAAAPFPEYDLVRLDETFCLRFERGPMVPYEATQGCNFRCAFCERVNGSAFRSYSPPRVVSDLAAIRRHSGAQAVFFTDEHLDYRPAYFEKLMRTLAAHRDLGLCYYAAARLSEIARERLDLMREAGVAILHCFAESGSARIRQAMKKQVDIERFMENATYASAQGLFVVAGFIAGWPDETEAELDATLTLADHPAFDFFNLTPLSCLARSELAPHLAARGIEPDTAAYYEYLNHQRSMVVAGYSEETLSRAMRRAAELNRRKLARPETQDKLRAFGCHLEEHPLAYARG